MEKQKYKMGIVGLGVMGRNFLLNIAEKGFPVAGYDKDTAKVESLRQEAKDLDIGAADTLAAFMGMLQEPRAVMLLVPAGSAVDSVIHDLLPFLSKNDVIIDAGNSYYKDTNLRAKKLAEKGIQFLGVGISGGEEGARHGPSIMPGGPKDVYEQIRPIFEAAAAKVGGDPCVAYLGSGSAGHFVKMVHNGIEYGVMQILAESYDLMKRGLGFTDDRLHHIYANWNEGELNSYLVEITGHIFLREDFKTKKRLIDEILSTAEQKGTGMWTSQSAMELQVPTPCIDLAVDMRNLSLLEAERERASVLFPRPIQLLKNDQEAFVEQLRHTVHLAIISVYAQGMELLRVASKKLSYNIDLETVARIWRGGCIIRAALLEDIRKAYRREPDLPNLMLDPRIAKMLVHQEDVRKVICIGVNMGIPIPCLMASLAYFDGYRSIWSPANLIQAQRDYFGAHTFELIGAKGTFHVDWETEQ